MSILSKDEIEDIVNNPLVQTNKEKLSTGNSINFSIPLTDTIKIKLEQLGLDVSQMSTVPMRWIKGDTAPHKDKGQDSFKNTHLIYLTDSVGNLIVDGQSYPIVAGEAHTFSEGLEHYTINTVGERLMMGPMSESGFRVGAASYHPIFFYTDDTLVTGGSPAGFLYFTPPESSIYGTITIFDFPPAPVTQEGLYFIQPILNPDWTPPPGKTFGGWKYLNYPDFGAPIVNDLSHIYMPGETYEYSAACILVPNWIEVPQSYPIFFLTMEVTNNTTPGFIYIPLDISIYGTITIFDVPPTPVTQEGLYLIVDFNAQPDWTPPSGKRFGGWKFWNFPPGTDGYYPINSDLSHIYMPGETYEYSAGCVLVPNWIDLPRPTPPPRFSLHFSNNAMVYYKPHSLSSGGGGSGVRNYRHKRRKT
jgi:hypothetical protein